MFWHSSESVYLLLHAEQPKEVWLQAAQALLDLQCCCSCGKVLGKVVKLLLKGAASMRYIGPRGEGSPKMPAQRVFISGPFCNRRFLQVAIKHLFFLQTMVLQV